jgi:N-acetyl sugar amidotransferase
MKILYNLPREVKFCKICVNSNQYPASTVEFKHTRDRKGASYVNFNEDGICDGCVQADIKNNKINWKNREKDLIKLLNKYRRNDGSYDCLVPGSGGKDSAYAAHLLKYKYKMNPLTVTWPPIMYTDYGKQNFEKWLEIGGFDNIVSKPNPRTMKLITRLAIENLLHPFQTFMLGQKNLAPKIAKQHNISLVFYGENEAEYGNPVADNKSSLRDKSFFTYKNMNDIFLSGVKVTKLIKKYKVSLTDLSQFLPLSLKEFKKNNIQVHYLGYYIKWIPQEAYYYAVENTGFKARPHRTEGTYSKYNSIDDKIDDLHYYTRFIKFGIGRATDDASQEIRNNHINREEAQQLVKRFDGEFPQRYFSEIMEYLEMDPKKFHKLCDKFRSPHLWKKINGKWKLRHTVNFDGTDDKKNLNK